MELWLIFILLSATLLAAWMLMLRRNVTHDPGPQVFSIFPLVALVLLPILSFLTGTPLEHEKVFGTEYLFLSAVGFLLVIKTATIAISLFCSSIAMRKLPMTIVAPLRNLSPLFVAILGFLLLGEALSFVNIIGLIVIVCSIMLLDIDIRHPTNLEKFFKDFKNVSVLLLFLGGFVLGFTAILDRTILDFINTFTTLFYFLLFLLIFYWIFYIVAYRKLPIQGITLHEILWILLSGIVVMMSDIFYFFAIASSTIPLAIIVGIRRLSNLAMAIFGGAVLHEEHGLYKACICVITIFGTILLLL